MGKYIRSDAFIDIAKECFCDPKLIKKHIKANFNETYTPSTSSIRNRIANYRRKGLLPLDSGNTIDTGQILRGTSTNYGPDGEIRQQWVKTDVDQERQTELLQASWDILAAEKVTPIAKIPCPAVTDSELLTFYPFADLHIGMLADEEYTLDSDYNLKIAEHQAISAMKYLVDATPNSETAIVADLGDILHLNTESPTTKSGHLLDVDGRFPKVMATAQRIFVTLIELALAKHKYVRFIGVPGNHADTACYAIHSYLQAYFKDNDNFKVDESPATHKYYQHGKTLLGFHHGHTTKAAKASSVMVADNLPIISDTLCREFHYGHYHTNKVLVDEQALCTVIVHKQLTPSDYWASSMGYRTSNLGEATAITYSNKGKRVGTVNFTIDIDLPDI